MCPVAEIALLKQFSLLEHGRPDAFLCLIAQRSGGTGFELSSLLLILFYGAAQELAFELRVFALFCFRSCPPFGALFFSCFAM